MSGEIESGRGPEGVWWWSGRGLGRFWEVSERGLGSVWWASGRDLGSDWWASSGCLVRVWEMSEDPRRLPPRHLTNIPTRPLSRHLSDTI